MRIAYVLLSSTFGMHQYTADLARETARSDRDVHLVTTCRYPVDRYAPGLRVHTPLTTEGTGFCRAGLRGPELAAALRTLEAIRPDLVHITGAHLWNLPILWRLRQLRVPVVHTLHDLDPHPGVPYGRLIRVWNRMVVQTADHILVHGEIFRQRLLAGGRPPESVTAMPLLHLFVGDAATQKLAAAWPPPAYGRWALFFGRLEAYKGIPDLLAAGRACAGPGTDQWLVLAGQGNLDALWRGPLPAGVEVRSRLIGDQEGVSLFTECGVVVLPYTGASQSALVAAAYAFGKPVIVSQSGALAEYVQPGVTGWVVPPGDPAALEDCLCTALGDPGQLARMGMAGRRWYDVQRQQADVLLASAYAHAATRSISLHRTRPNLRTAFMPIYGSVARK